jgi:hypothetical protein
MSFACEEPQSVPALNLLHEAGHVGDLEPTYKSLMP